MITRGNCDAGCSRQRAEKRLGLEDLNVQRLGTKNVNEVTGDRYQIVVLGCFIKPFEPAMGLPGVEMTVEF